VSWQLEDAGYRVLVQAWDFVPGSNWAVRMQEGVAGAERTIALLSAAYLDSAYGQEEWQAAQAADPQGFARKLLPVRVEEDCPQPGPLETIVSIDLFGRPAETARRHLLDAIGHTLAGRAKPGTEPAFPRPTSQLPAEPAFPGPSGPLLSRSLSWLQSRRHRRAGIVAAVALAAGVVLGLLIPRDGGPPEQQKSLATLCDRVTVLTGQRGSPYNEYGEVIARLIREAGVEAVAEPTPGTKYNLERVSDQGSPRCTIAMVGLPTAVDGRFLRGPWLGADRDKLDDIAAVGPVSYDIIHVLVRTPGDLPSTGRGAPREPRSVGDIRDLCDPGVVVDMGVANSGTHAIGAVIQKILGEGDPGKCPWKDVNADGRDDEFHNLPYSLSKLRDGRVDAVIWVSGSPTLFIENFAASAPAGPELRLLPLTPECREGRDPGARSFLAAMQKDWEGVYGVGGLVQVENGGEAYPGPVYSCQTIHPDDYAFIPAKSAGISTVGVPNALVAHKDTDPDLVRFLAEALVRDVGELQRALWRDDTARNGREFPGARLGRGADNPLNPPNPLFCVIPLHDAAAGYYKTMHGLDVPGECAAKRVPVRAAVAPG
jgi:TRAP-type uncharacterized transport system substrate-binding protein